MSADNGGSDSEEEKTPWWLAPIQTQPRPVPRQRKRGTPKAGAPRMDQEEEKWWHVPDSRLEAMVKSLSEKALAEAAFEGDAATEQPEALQLQRSSSAGSIASRRSRASRKEKVKLDKIEQPKMIFQDNPKLFAPVGACLDGHKVPIPYTPFAEYGIYRGDAAHSGLQRIRSLPCYTTGVHRRWGGA
eukprot:TRINITY_DN19046_c0_g1_i1.p1 TRINITY_DN19046_c0_g1~~TRINITY_DN19046_c0_g1_i1.p1  ORF type:complete len:210 (-),score=25.34 TRINITY_DN19046_c0_g1_i1:50-610(-)